MLAPMSARGLGWWLGAALVFGCAGQNQPPTASPNSAGVTGVEVAPDGPSVVRPKDWIAVGRVKGYPAWGGAQGLPPALQWAMDQIAKERPILAHLDPALPIEFALVFDPTWRAAPTAELEPPAAAPDEQDTEPVPEPKAEEDDPLEHVLGAVSIPLQPLDDARYRALGFTRDRDGTWSDSRCVVSAAVGVAKTRLVCAEDVSAARRLTPYLTRALPLEALSTAPAYAEFSAAPLRTWWLELRAELQQQVEALKSMASPTALAAYGIAFALFDETDAWLDALGLVRVESRLLENGELSASVQAHFDASPPWLLEGYLATASSIEGPPQSFLALPADSRSVGYDYALPPARAARIQSAVTELLKTALQEYGPLSQNLPGDYNRAQKRALDTATTTLLGAMQSPCLTSRQVSWASGAPGLPKDEALLPFDQLLPRFAGYVMYSTPTEAQCPAFLAALVDAADVVYKSLPKATRDGLPLQVSKRQTQRFQGLPVAQVQRLTLPRKLLDSELVNTAGSVATRLRWSPARGPLRYTLITLSNADGQGNDWLAAGFDEAELVGLLRTVLGQGGKTLRERPDLAVLSQTRPLQYSERTYGELDLVSFYSAPEPWQQLGQLVLGTRVHTTLTLTRNAAGSDAVLAYRLPQASVQALSKVLDWDKQRLDALSAASNQPATLSGPIGIVREVEARGADNAPSP